MKKQSKKYLPIVLGVSFVLGVIFIVGILLYNLTYYFTLTGSSAKGFTFEPTENNNIDFTITPYSELPEDIFE